MFLLNEKPIKIDRFPDGTQKIDLPLVTQSTFTSKITWRYENETEYITLWYLVKHIREKFPKTDLTLFLPYIPNARFDRTYADTEVFTLKWFAEFINSLQFTSVVVLDPHSDVSTALINHVRVKTPLNWVKIVINSIENAGYEPVLYFPDAGALKRYKYLIGEYPFLYGEKSRDWKTGKILGLNFHGQAEAIEVLQKPVFLMIDDICSHGGTFYYSAKALKEAFPTCYINSWATHTEHEFPTLQKAFDEGLILNHFTTNSFYCHTHDKIKTFNAW